MDGGPARARGPHCSHAALLLAFLVLAASCCSAPASPQSNAVTEESSSVSVRGGCGTTSNSHAVCSPDGKLRCRAGWAGKQCDKPRCRGDCHSEHGHCNKPGECLCRPGWRGGRCDECVPEVSCQHGSCHNSTSECHCHDGWRGAYCSHAICRSDCHSSRGYCDAPRECKCRIGWGGATCDKCAVVPGCQNGYCQKPLECRCNPGWSGHLCQNPVCSEGCDSVHGSCKKPGECRCSVGWTGKTCNACHAYPGCKNGYCLHPWECICQPGWTGMQCDKRVERRTSYCSVNSNACLNGGTCIDVLGPRNYTCSCPSLFTGKRCDYLAERRPRPSHLKSFIISTSQKNSTSIKTAAQPTTTSISTTLIATTTKKTTTTATRSPASPFLSLIKLEDDEDDPLDEDYEETPTGQHSRIHSVTASPRKLKQELKQRELDEKNARRLFLRKQARITFRQPKLVPTIRTRSRPLKLPFTLIDRKHLSLPVFLPRVIEFVRKNKTDTKGHYKGAKTVVVKPDIDDANDTDYADDSSDASVENTTVGHEITTSVTFADIRKETNNEKALLEQKQTTKNSTGNNDDIERFNGPSKTKFSISHKIDSHIARKQSEFNEQSRGEQTIKDLLEEYERPKPVLVVDYNNPDDKNVNEIQLAPNNQIEDSLFFINEKRRFSLNLGVENSQESHVSGPSRPPMILVAVRPVPSSSGSVRTLQGRSVNPLIGFSHGSYHPATLIQESRNGKFLPQRPLGALRGNLQLASPSFSVSQSHNYHLKHFPPQRRLSRRIGHSVSTSYIQSYSNKDTTLPEANSTPASTKKSLQYYDEHSAGSVHIGVDRHTPHEAIILAFIEIKKAHS